jgi:hypothetical protein
MITKYLFLSIISKMAPDCDFSRPQIKIIELLCMFADMII